MTDGEALNAFERTRQQYVAIIQALVPLAERIALASVADVLPDMWEIDVHGEVNEDWIPTLRIQRVRDRGGAVLFDARFGHDDRAIEETIDTVNTEYLDLLIDLTGDDFTGYRVMER